MPERQRIAIVAALKREMWPLIRTWQPRTIRYQGREFTFYESGYAVVVCGGIGSESSRRAAEAAVAEYSPELLISAGIAGALVRDLHVGETVFPATVIDSQDGSRHQTSIPKSAVGVTNLGRTVVITYPKIASSEQKLELAKSYSAHLVDMEAAAVARAAQVHNLPFVAVKAISDAVDFDIRELNRFIRNGQFATKSLVIHVILRPWVWLKMIRLSRNTRTASDNLCAWLRESALTNTIVPDGIERHQS